MEPEYTVLNHLHENEITTQRRISKRTGLSLGAVNLLLKKMARKGLIKIEKLNARTMRYILTSQGIQEKSRLTYHFIRQSYKQIIRINQAMDHLITERAAAIDGEAILLCGPTDEIREILMEYLKHQDLLFEVCPKADSIDKLDMQNSRMILVWREEEEKLLGDCHKAVNLMNII
jgi:DNA-binding MarR family transcriptional regulator